MDEYANYEWKKKYLPPSKHKQNFYVGDVTNHLDKETCKGLLSMARFVTFEGDTLLLAQNKHINIISATNELAAWELISSTCTQYLSLYTTTLEKDNQKLKDKANTLSFNHKNCITYRAGEKKILNSFIQMLRKMNKLFSMEQSLA